MVILDGRILGLSTAEVLMEPIAVEGSMLFRHLLLDCIVGCMSARFGRHLTAINVSC